MMLTISKLLCEWNQKRHHHVGRHAELGAAVAAGLRLDSQRCSLLKGSSVLQ